eukprot:CAMPEP_0204566378 /NCGR_PEP_ID=MMETSP0661-20131031/36016_1 /ASSEMBLY_ACC=CAM_ASM_000606 /TAXON_ID=109239 /ORGANISM="Alexandrium margalefi, Strain AMGDE01CS-322" /LENGTH=123 /DNA_ID=CAMNT_0051574219 /DNA_START=107 /DNA_END=474 /DNA_ORIENTATION=+
MGLRAVDAGDGGELGGDEAADKGRGLCVGAVAPDLCCILGNVAVCHHPQPPRPAPTEDDVGGLQEDGQQAERRCQVEPRAARGERADALRGGRRHLPARRVGGRERRVELLGEALHHRLHGLR